MGWARLGQALLHPAGCVAPGPPRGRSTLQQGGPGSKPPRAGTLPVALLCFTPASAASKPWTDSAAATDCSLEAMLLPSALRTASGAAGMPYSASSAWPRIAADRGGLPRLSCARWGETPPRGGRREKRDGGEPHNTPQPGTEGKACCGPLRPAAACCWARLWCHCGPLGNAGSKARRIAGPQRAAGHVTAVVHRILQSTGRGAAARRGVNAHCPRPPLTASTARSPAASGACATACSCCRCTRCPHGGAQTRRWMG